MGNDVCHVFRKIQDVYNYRLVPYPDANFANTCDQPLFILIL